MSSVWVLNSALAWIVPGRWRVNVEHRDLRLEIQMYVFNYWSVLNTENDLYNLKN